MLLLLVLARVWRLEEFMGVVASFLIAGGEGVGGVDFWLGVLLADVVNVEGTRGGVVEVKSKMRCRAGEKL